jgi:hypothetical protein
MKKQNPKKLQLNKQSIRQLSDELARVRGGMEPTTATDRNWDCPYVP